jgi:hypothetical protein
MCKGNTGRGRGHGRFCLLGLPQASPGRSSIVGEALETKLLPPLYYFFPGMPVATRADKISHGLCLFPCYLYTFAMIPFFALVTPDHELSPVWFPTNTIKLIPIPTLMGQGVKTRGFGVSVGHGYS